MRQRRCAPYSAVFPDLPETDESPLIELQQRLRSSGLVLEVHGGSVLGGTSQYLQEWGLPDISSNCFFFQALLERVARGRSRSLLDGEGGDELFETAPTCSQTGCAPAALVSLLALDDARSRIGGRRQADRIAASLRSRSGRCRRGRLPALARLLEAEPAARLPSTGTAERQSRARRPDSWKRTSGPRWWSFLVDLLTGGGETIGAAEHHLRLTRPGALASAIPCSISTSCSGLRLPPELSFDRSFRAPSSAGPSPAGCPKRCCCALPRATSTRSARTRCWARPALVRRAAARARCADPRATHDLTSSRADRASPAAAGASSWGAACDAILHGRVLAAPAGRPGFAARMLERAALEAAAAWRASGARLTPAPPFLILITFSSLPEHLSRSSSSLLPPKGGDHMETETYTEPRIADYGSMR